MPIQSHRCTTCRHFVANVDAREKLKVPTEGDKDAGICTKDPVWQPIEKPSVHWCGDHIRG